MTIELNDVRRALEDLDCHYDSTEGCWRKTIALDALTIEVTRRLTGNPLDTPTATRVARILQDMQDRLNEAA
jgi:hypothetical protein